MSDQANDVPELATARALFERGDFRGAQHEAQRFVSDPRPDVQAAARAEVARFSADPWALRLAIIGAVIISASAAVYLGR